MFVHIYVYMACTYVKIHIVTTTKSILVPLPPSHIPLHVYEYGIVGANACRQV